MARKPSSGTGVIDAFPGIRPIGPAQTSVTPSSGGGNNSRLQTNPATKTTRFSGNKQPGASAVCDASPNLSILRAGK